MSPSLTTWLTAAFILISASWTQELSHALDETQLPRARGSARIYEELLKDASRDPVDLTPDTEEAGKREAGLADVRLFRTAFGVKADAGYITVNSTCQRKLYFIHVRSSDTPRHAPLMLWLPGAEPGEKPGDASSLFTLFLENGPVGIDKAGYFYKRKHTLQSTFNVVYLDALAGTGYSTAASNDDFPKTMDELTEDILEFLVKFLKLHPRYRNRQFYVGGERYGVRTAIQVGLKLLTERGEKLKLQLAGVICGSGLFAPLHTQRDLAKMGIMQRLRAAGDIEENEKTKILQPYSKAADLAGQKEYKKALESIEESFQKLGNASPFLEYTYFGNLNQQKEPDQFRLFRKLVASSDFKVLMHAGENATFTAIDYDRFPFLLEHYFKNISSSVEKILESTRLLVYVGGLDETFSSSATQTFFENLQWSGHDELVRILRLRDPHFTRRMFNITYKLVEVVGHFPGFDNSAVTNELIYDFTKDMPIKINGVS